MGKERDNFFASLPKRGLVYEPLQTIKIGKRLVGAGQPAYIIAEVGSNHRKDFKTALRMIDIAAEAGADAVKFQHLRGTDIAADTVIYDSWHGKAIGPLSGFYETAELDYSWTGKLVAHAKKRSITFLSTPFDHKAVNVLDKAGVPAFKVASYELTSDALLRDVARRGRPIILSTGMATLEEVAHAVRVCQEEGNNQIVILHCVSIYPPRPGDFNLKAVETLWQAFKLPVGYSDHSKPPFVAVAVAAVALGACMLEKHITDSRAGGSNDDPNSVTPEEFTRYVAEVRAAEAAMLGSGIKQPVSRVNKKTGQHDSDEVFDRFARRSLYAAKNMPAGHKLSQSDVCELRPFGGAEALMPADLNRALGRKLVRAIKSREALTWSHLMS